MGEEQKPIQPTEPQEGAPELPAMMGYEETPVPGLPEATPEATPTPAQPIEVQATDQEAEDVPVSTGNEAPHVDVPLSEKEFQDQVVKDDAETPSPTTPDSATDLDIESGLTASDNEATPISVPENEKEFQAALADPAAPLPEGDGRWDKQKAETIGAGLKESGELDTGLKGRERKLDLEQDHIDRYTEYPRSQLEKAKEKVASQTWYNTLPGDRADTRKDVDDNQAGYDKAIEPMLERKAEFSDRLLQDLNEDVQARVLGPAEELYDLNPKLFADMTTKVFMEKVQELAYLDVDAKRLENGKLSFSDFADEVVELLDEKMPVDPRLRTQIDKSAKFIMQLSPEDAEAVTAKIDAVWEDSFDKSPRQINEGVLQLLKDLGAEITAQQEAAVQKHAELLESYKQQPQPEQQ